MIMSDYDDSDEMACLEVMIDRSPSPTRNSANPSWESRYGELLKWRAEKGDTRVPKAEGALGRWVARQRELKRTGSKFIFIFCLFCLNYLTSSSGNYQLVTDY